MPSPGNYFIQTSVDKQVNLVNTNGLTLNYWDGALGPKNDGQVNGGSGVWTANGALTNDNWTGMDGALNAPWTQSAFAVFMGQSGIVSVDSIINGPLLTQGMQFAANGYTLVNNTALDALTLVGVPVSGGPNEAVIRVGDGTAGGPAIPPPSPPRWPPAGQDRPGHAGAVRRQHLPAARPSTAARCRSRRTATWAPWRAGCRSMAARWPRPRHSTRRAPPRWARRRQHQCRGGHQLRHHQRRRRQRRAEQAGQRHAGPHAGYAGGTTISAGTLQLGSGRGSATGGILGNVANNGTLAFNRSNSYTFGGLVSGTGGVTQLGGGTTILTADNTYGRHHDFGGHAATGRGGATAASSAMS